MIRRKTITIGGQRWKVHVGCRLVEKHGEVDYDRRIIRIATHDDPIELLLTILHEFSHVVQPYLCEEAVEDIEDAFRVAVKLFHEIKDAA